MLHYGKSITCEGYVIDGKGDINYSDIMTELIQAAGTLCEYYASDVFYDLEILKSWVDSARSEMTFIGIRTHGVDGYDFVKSRLENSDLYGTNNYIRLYRLETLNYDERSYKIELRRIDERDAEKELGIVKEGLLCVK